MARLVQEAPWVRTWPATFSSTPSSVITSSFAVEVARGVVETVAVSWLTPAVKFAVRSNGRTVATLRHSDTCAVESMLAGVIVNCGFGTAPGLFG